MDNIMNLAKEHKFKKIIVKRNTWGDSFCIVDKVHIRSNGYGLAWGRTTYSNGNTCDGAINCAGTYAWCVVEVLDEDMEVKYI